MIKNKKISFKLLFIIASLFLSAYGYSQIGLVKGTVVDEKGVPLMGTTVLVEGTTNGATTDFDGNYIINIKTQNAVLVFSYVGYITQKITLADQTEVNVILKEDLNTLEEVQVVAFSKQKKSSVIGSVSTIKVSDLKQPSSNVKWQG